MAKIRIPCLVGKSNKAGVTSWYWQPSATLAKAGWKPLTLGKDEGKAIAAARDRNKEVEDWKAGGSRPSTVRQRIQQGTFAALLKRYEEEWIDGLKPDGSRRIAESTAKTYRSAMKRLNAWAGKHPLGFITPRRVSVLRDAMLHPETGVGHHAAFQTLKQGRQVFAFAESQDLMPRGSNPFASFGLGAPEPRDVIWSPPARELMILTAYELGMPSMALAIMLGYAIGQREQDYVVMTQRHYVAIPEHKMQPEDWRTLSAIAPDGIVRGIRVRQRKTRAWVEVPVVGLVRWTIETAIATATTAGTTTLLLDDRRQSRDVDYRHAPGRNYADGKAGQNRFQDDFAEIREWAIAAAWFEGDEQLAEEIATLQFRDLRRTCVVYLGELGLEDHLIAAITGHDLDETRAILKTYMPRTTGRAARAIALASVREAREEERRADEKEQNA